MKINDIISCCDDCLTEATGLMFKGYPCTVDCGGHKSGYRWAALKMSGKTQADWQEVMAGIGTVHNSFWEGAKSFLEGR
jgi:cation diffusion facilitator CzcD-associated flavoprotein CzcO